MKLSEKKNINFLLLQQASNAYLGQPLPNNWEILPEEQQHKFIHDHIYEMYEFWETGDILKEMEHLAKDWKQFIQANEIKPTFKLPHENRLMKEIRVQYKETVTQWVEATIEVPESAPTETEQDIEELAREALYEISQEDGFDGSDILESSYTLIKQD